MSENNQTTPLKRPPLALSRTFLFFTVAVALSIGFVGGTRSRELLSVVAPVVGLHVETSTIDLSSVEKTYQALKGNYDGTLSAQDLIDGANRGLVAAAGDRYTVYLDAKDATEFDKGLSGQIGGGIGAEIGIRNDQPTIIRTLADNPAVKAGVHKNDVIVAVNSDSAVGWTAAKTADAIRGDIGTTLKLKVLRGTETKEFNITRANVTNPSVQSSVEDGIGRLTITRFDNDTAQLAKQAAQSFVRQNVKGVILDLRGNGGGYLTAAQEVAGLWVENKVVVSERTNGKETDALKSGDDATLAGIKTVVLVDGNTASASEIVAGALQDYNKATIVGAQTFGKGTVQKVIDLSDGTKLKVTVARWYTPNGKNINEEGITPDTKVEISTKQINNNNDPQLKAAEAVFS